MNVAGYIFAGIIVVFAVVVWLVKRRLERAVDDGTPAE